METLNTITEITQERIDDKLNEIADRGTLEQISFYMQFVKNPNKIGRWKKYPVQLILANSMSSEDKYTAMKTLLSAHPNVNVKDPGGRVPAMEAFAKNYRGIGLMLLAAQGADLAVQDSYKDGLLNYVAHTGSSHAMHTAMKLKVPYLVNKKEEGALSIAAQEKNVAMIEEIVQGLWVRGKNPANMPDFKKAFDVAYKMGDEVLQKALNRKKVPEEALALYAAHDKVVSGEITYTQTSEELERRLKKLPRADQEWAQIVLAGSVGETVPEKLTRALFSQIGGGTPHDMRIFLELGANPNTQNKFSQTPLLEAISSSLSASDRSNHMLELPESGPYDKVELLLRAGANPWEENKYGQVPFLWALAKNQPGIGALLLESVRPEQRSEMAQHKNTLKIKGKLAPGDGPLKYAAECGSPSAIKLVLKNGGNLEERGSQNKLAMYWAINAGKPANVMALWDAGFQVDMASQDGMEMKELLEKRRHTWEIKPKTDAEGHPVDLTEGEKTQAREVLYEKMVKAFNKDYQVPEKQTKKTVKKPQENEGALEEKLSTLELKDAFTLTALLDVEILSIRQAMYEEGVKARILQNKAAVLKGNQALLKPATNPENPHQRGNENKKPAQNSVKSFWKKLVRGR